MTGPERRGPVVTLDGHPVEPTWYANTVRVARYGADFQTIQSAVDYCDAIGGQWIIELYAFGTGVWDEGDITSAGTSIITLRGMSEHVLIAPAIAPATAVINITETMYLENITVISPDAAIPAVLVNTAAGAPTITDCIIVGEGVGYSLQMTQGSLNVHRAAFSGDVHLSTARCLLDCFFTTFLSDILTAAEALNHDIDLMSCEFTGGNITSLATGATVLAIEGGSDIGTITDSGTGLFTITGSYVDSVSCLNAAGEIRIRGGTVNTWAGTNGVIVWYITTGVMRLLLRGVLDDINIVAAIAALPASGGLIEMPEGIGEISSVAGIDPGSKSVRVSGSGRATILRLANGVDADGSVFVAADTGGIILENFVLDGNEANQAAGDMYGLDFENVVNSRVRIWIENFTAGDAKLKGCTVDFNNLNYDPSYCKPVLIHDFEDAGNLTFDGSGGGAGALDNTIANVEGDYSVKLTVPGAGGYEEVLITLPSAYDLRFRFPRLWVRVNFANWLGALRLRFYKTYPGEYFEVSTWNLDIVGFGIRYADLIWHKLDIWKSQCSKTGVTDADWASIEAVELRQSSQGAAGGLSYVWLDLFEFVPAAPRGEVILRFGDNYDTQYDPGASIIAKYGFVGNLGVVHSQVGQTPGPDGFNHMTEAEQRELVRRGWEIWNHSWSHINLEGVLEDVGWQEMVWNQRYLKGQGYQSSFFAFPQNASKYVDRLAAQILHRDWMAMSGRTSGGAVDRKVPTYQVDARTGEGAVNPIMDDVLKFHESVELLIHKIVIGDCLPASLDAMCSHLYDLGLEVPTLTKLYDRWGVPPAPDFDAGSARSGTAVILNLGTSIVVDHGLPEGAIPRMIIVTGQDVETVDCYVTTIGANQFTITVPVAVSADRTVSWKVEI